LGLFLVLKVFFKTNKQTNKIPQMQRNSLTTLGIENKENKTKLVFIINMFLFIGEG